MEEVRDGRARTGLMVGGGNWNISGSSQAQTPTDMMQGMGEDDAILQAVTVFMVGPNLPFLPNPLPSPSHMLISGCTCHAILPV